MNDAALLDLPEHVQPPVEEDPLFEIIDGQRVELPPMSAYAAILICELVYELNVYARPAGVPLAAGDVVPGRSVGFLKLMPFAVE